VRRGTFLKEQLEAIQGLCPSFPGRDFPGCAPVPAAEVWRAVREAAELLSRWVAPERLAARVEAALSALPGLLEAPLAQEEAAGSDAQVGPVRAFEERESVVQVVERRGVVPGLSAAVFARA